VVDIYARWRPLAASGLSLKAGIENVRDEDFERRFAGVSVPGRANLFDIS